MKRESLCLLAFGVVLALSCGGGGASRDVLSDTSDLTDASLSDGTELPADPEAPTAPNNLVAQMRSFTSARLTWTASTDNVGVAGYKVFDQDAEIGTTTELTFNHDGLVPDSTHCYRVRAFDLAGNVSMPSIEACITLSETADVTEEGDGTNLANVDHIKVTSPRDRIGVDETIELMATAYDEDSEVLSGVTFTWGSNDPSKATVSESGLVTGISAGEVTITASAGDVASDSAYLTVVAKPLLIVPPDPPEATVGAAYSHTFHAVGGTPPYTWVAAIRAPHCITGIDECDEGNGLELSPSTGVLAGTPTFGGPMPLGVEVTDSEGTVADATYLFHVSGMSYPTPNPYHFTNGDPATATVGTTYSPGFSLTVGWSDITGCDTAVKAAWGKYPPGLGLCNDGVGQPACQYSGPDGVPLTAGTYSVALFASQSSLCSSGLQSTDMYEYTFDVNTASAPASPFDAASNWRRVNDTTAVLSPTTGAWDEDYLSAPSVVKQGMTYFMFYEGRGGAEHVRQIGLATSSNGINWTKSSANPVLTPGDADSWDARGVASPVVYWDGTIFRMWYYGSSYGLGSEGAIGLATSTDGTTWVKHTQPVFGITEEEGLGLIPGSVVKDGEKFILFYAYGDLFSDNYGKLGSASSSDGITWTDNEMLHFDQESSYVLTRPSVVADGNLWRLWYMREGDNVDWTTSTTATAYDLSGSGACGFGCTMLTTQNTIAFAASGDSGANWTFWDGNPIFVGAISQWDSPGVSHPCAMLDGGLFKMWYTAGPIRDGIARGAIGFAAIPAGR